MPDRKLTEFDELYRKEQVARAYLQGRSLHAVADELHLQVRAVADTVKLLKAEWRQSAKDDISERMGSELARIDELEATYWRAWELSMHPRTHRMSVHKPPEGDAPTPRPSMKGQRGVRDFEYGAPKLKEADALVAEANALNLSSVITNEYEQNGDPKFLEGVQWCITKRCEILGLDAPKTPLGAGGVGEHGGQMLKVREVVIEMTPMALPGPSMTIDGMATAVPEGQNQ